MSEEICTKCNQMLLDIEVGGSNQFGQLLCNDCFKDYQKSQETDA